jgi:hypothetical protein
LGAILVAPSEAGVPAVTCIYKHATKIGCVHRSVAGSETYWATESGTVARDDVPKDTQRYVAFEGHTYIYRTRRITFAQWVIIPWGRGRADAVGSVRRRSTHKWDIYRGGRRIATAVGPDGIPVGLLFFTWPSSF